MAQLGSGLVGSSASYPSVIDTRQTFQNGTPLAPDSATRLDAEIINDLAASIVAIETTLGANPQGVFASVLARLIALEARVAALEGA